MLNKIKVAKIHWILSSQFGFNVKLFLWSLRGIPEFIIDLLNFRSSYKGQLTLLPCLHDRYEEGGSTKHEYFWQDLVVAQRIFESKPVKHVDIGSRVDGFIAHVASFREIEVIDIRPLTTTIPGVVFRKGDVMNYRSLPGSDEDNGYCDSLSCLHALEHFGLGRYGDQIDSEGYLNGITNMAKLLKPAGVLYLSTPIGRERVEFNANWIFDPRKIIEIAKDSGLKLTKLTIINQIDGGEESKIDDETLCALAHKNYSLALFTLVKNTDENVLR
jgi:hypothetical protein